MNHNEITWNSAEIMFASIKVWKTVNHWMSTCRLLANLNVSDSMTLFSFSFFTGIASGPTQQGGPHESHYPHFWWVQKGPLYHPPPSSLLLMVRSVRSYNTSDFHIPMPPVTWLNGYDGLLVLLTPNPKGKHSLLLLQPPSPFHSLGNMTFH